MKLAQLIQPLTTQEFFSSYWEKKPLVLSRQSPDTYRELLSLDDVDSALTEMGARYPDITLATGEKIPNSGEFTFADGSIDPVAVFKLFSKGTSIVLSNMQRKLPKLTALCRSLTAETSIPFQANLYLTPPRSQGFRLHYDTHDVFILQIAGSKNWRIYGSPVELPARGRGYSTFKEDPGALSDKFVLQQGDLLYMPRGWYHEAISDESTSLHITLGVNSLTWSDFLFEALGSACLKDVSFRRSLPIGFANPGFDANQAKNEFLKLLDALPDKIDFESTLKGFTNELIRTQAPETRDQLSNVIEIDRIGLGTIIRKRPNLIFRFDNTADGVSLTCSNNEIVFPEPTRESLDYIFSHDIVQVSQIPGPLDTEGKLTLAKRLVLE
ncbi:MAG TPA: cupin domain-containing protein, partial [Chthoniobacterales bacterium]|nr:cupin domain-containing protein [Chthoniobacterales bacterium]